MPETADKLAAQAHQLLDRRAQLETSFLQYESQARAALVSGNRKAGIVAYLGMISTDAALDRIAEQIDALKISMKRLLDRT